MSSSVEIVSSDTVTHAVAMASASIMTKNNRKNEGGSKEGRRPLTTRRDETEEEEEEEVEKLRRLVQILQRERGNLQQQCSTFERAGMQVTTHNVDLKEKIKSLQATTQSLQCENQSLSERLMEVTTHINQVIMPKYHWYFQHTRTLEFQYGVLLNNHHHLRSFCDSLLQKSNNHCTRGEHGPGAGPIAGAAAQAQETTQRYSNKKPKKITPSDYIASKRLHHPFLQPRPSKFVEDDNEKNPKNHEDQDLLHTTDHCTKSTELASRRGRPSLQEAKSTSERSCSFQETEKVTVDTKNGSDKVVSSKSTTLLQRPSTSHDSSPSVADEPIAATPKLTDHTGSTVCSMESRSKVDPASARVPIAAAVSGTYQMGQQVTPSPQISYQMMPGVSNGAQQLPLFPHPYLTSIPNQNLVEQRNAIHSDSHALKGLRTYAPHTFSHPPHTFHGSTNKIHSKQNQYHVVGQKRKIASSGRGGSHCFASKKKKPNADL